MTSEEAMRIILMNSTAMRELGIFGPSVSHLCSELERIEALMAFNCGDEIITAGIAIASDRAALALACASAINEEEALTQRELLSRYRPRYDRHGALPLMINAALERLAPKSRNARHRKSMH